MDGRVWRGRRGRRVVLGHAELEVEIEVEIERHGDLLGLGLVVHHLILVGGTRKSVPAHHEHPTLLALPCLALPCPALPCVGTRQ